MQQAAGIEARLDSSGKIGELSVWVADHLVVRKGLFKFPDKRDVLAAVKRCLDQTQPGGRSA